MTHRATEAVLDRERVSIIGSAADSIRLARTHYELAGSEETRRRLEALFDQVLAALRTRSLAGIADYAHDLAAERFESGYDLSDVQTALNALEEATWSMLCARVAPDELPLALGLVGTVFGAVKDALAREYVSLASQTHVTSLDLRALFSGGVEA